MSSSARPGTWALLAAFYRDRRGSTYPGCDASALIDEVGLTLWSLQRRAEAGAGRPQRPDTSRSCPARRAGQEPWPPITVPRRPLFLFFSFLI